MNSFVCRYSGEPEEETYSTTVSPYTISDNKLSNVDIELEVSQQVFNKKLTQKFTSVKVFYINSKKNNQLP